MLLREPDLPHPPPAGKENSSATADPSLHLDCLRAATGDITYPTFTFAFKVSRCIPIVDCHSHSLECIKQRQAVRPPGRPLLLLFLPGTAMSASDVLRKLVKRDMTSPESRRALNELLRSPCCKYFLKTLQGSDVLGYVDFLDKASTESIQSVRGSYRFSRH